MNLFKPTDFKVAAFAVTQEEILRDLQYPAERPASAPKQRRPRR